MKFWVSLQRRGDTTATDGRLDYIPPLVEAAAALVQEAIHTRQLQHTLLLPEGRSPVHISARKQLVQIALRNSLVKHPRRSVPILRLSVRMRSKRGKT